MPRSKAGTKAWPPHVRERAHELYVAWTGNYSQNEVAEYVHDVLHKEHKIAPDRTTIYRWASAGRWEQERQEKMKAQAFDRVVEETGKGIAEVEARDFISVLEGYLREDLEKAGEDRKLITHFQALLAKAGATETEIDKLAVVVAALSRASHAKLHRASVVGRILELMARSMEARAELVKGGRCPAMTGEGPIPESCPIVRNLTEGEDEPES